VVAIGEATVARTGKAWAKQAAQRAGMSGTGGA
jgi:hypothetical protein